MSDLVLIPIPGIGVLALNRDVFQQALADGAAFTSTAEPARAAAVEPLLDSRQLGELLGVGDTLLEQMAKDGRIPSVRIGKYLRFETREVIEALRLRHADNRSAVPLQAIDSAGAKSTRHQKTTTRITHPIAGRYTRDTEGRV